MPGYYHWENIQHHNHVYLLRDLLAEILLMISRIQIELQNLQFKTANTLHVDYLS